MIRGVLSPPLALCDPDALPLGHRLVHVLGEELGREQHLTSL